MYFQPKDFGLVQHCKSIFGLTKKQIDLSLQIID